MAWHCLLWKVRLQNCKKIKKIKKKKKCDTIFGTKHLTLPSKLLRNCLDTLIHTQMYAYKH